MSTWMPQWLQAKALAQAQEAERKDRKEMLTTWGDILFSRRRSYRPDRSSFGHPWVRSLAPYSQFERHADSNVTTRHMQLFFDAVLYIVLIIALAAFVLVTRGDGTTAAGRWGIAGTLAAAAIAAVTAFCTMFRLAKRKVPVRFFGPLTLILLPWHLKLRKEFEAAWRRDHQNTGSILVHEVRAGKLSTVVLSKVRTVVEAEFELLENDAKERLSKTLDTKKKAAALKQESELKKRVVATLENQADRIRTCLAEIQGNAKAFREQYGSAAAEVEEIEAFKAIIDGARLSELNEAYIEQLQERTTKLREIVSTWDASLKAATEVKNTLVSSIPEITEVYTPPLLEISNRA